MTGRQHVALHTAGMLAAAVLALLWSPWWLLTVAVEWWLASTLAEAVDFLDGVEVDRDRRERELLDAEAASHDVVARLRRPLSSAIRRWEAVQQVGMHSNRWRRLEGTVDKNGLVWFWEDKARRIYALKAPIETALSWADRSPVPEAFYIVTWIEPGTW